MLSELGEKITAESTEESIAASAVELLMQHGVIDTWYYSVPAFVLLGSRSCLSISGCEYLPACEQVGMVNVVTVDLSPCIGPVWGDCARTFCIEKGVYTPAPHNKEFFNGLRAEAVLHKEMAGFVTPETRFCDLFDFGNELIKTLGFENLDFLSNLGHSIEQDRNKRRYIDAGCNARLSDVSLFTFEPHIRQKGGRWGVKHENIYYFDESDKVCDL